MASLALYVIMDFKKKKREKPEFQMSKVGANSAENSVD